MAVLFLVPVLFALILVIQGKGYVSREELGREL